MSDIRTNLGRSPFDVDRRPEFPRFFVVLARVSLGHCARPVEGERELVGSFLSRDKNLGTNLKIIVERKSVVFRSYVSLSFSDI